MTESVGPLVDKCVNQVLHLEDAPSGEALVLSRLATNDLWQVTHRGSALHYMDVFRGLEQKPLRDSIPFGELLEICGQTLDVVGVQVDGSITTLRDLEPSNNLTSAQTNAIAILFQYQSVLFATMKLLFGCAYHYDLESNASSPSLTETYLGVACEFLAIDPVADYPFITDIQRSQIDDLLSGRTSLGDTDHSNMVYATLRAKREKLFYYQRTVAFLHPDREMLLNWRKSSKQYPNNFVFVPDGPILTLVEYIATRLDVITGTNTQTDPSNSELDEVINITERLLALRALLKFNTEDSRSLLELDKINRKIKGIPVTFINQLVQLTGAAEHNLLVKEWFELQLVNLEPLRVLEENFSDYLPGEYEDNHILAVNVVLPLMHGENPSQDLARLYRYGPVDLIPYIRDVILISWKDFALGVDNLALIDPELIFLGASIYPEMYEKAKDLLLSYPDSESLRDLPPYSKLTNEAREVYERQIDDLVTHIQKYGVDSTQPHTHYSKESIPMLPSRDNASLHMITMSNLAGDAIRNNIGICDWFAYTITHNQKSNADKISIFLRLLPFETRYVRDLPYTYRENGNLHHSTLRAENFGELMVARMLIYIRSISLRNSRSAVRAVRNFIESVNGDNVTGFNCGETVKKYAPTLGLNL